MRPLYSARVLAVLAYGPGYATGILQAALTMHVRLTRDGRLDPRFVHVTPYRIQWRLSEATKPRSGTLVLYGTDWLMHPDCDDDEPLWSIAIGVFRPGEYITLYPPGRAAHVFRIVNIERVADADAAGAG